MEKYVEEVTVPCLTLPTLLRKRGIQGVNPLQVDTEGFDCEIVRMALDAELRPQIINYVAFPPLCREEPRSARLARRYAPEAVRRATIPQ